MSNAHSQDIYLLDHLVSHLTSPLFLGDETQLLKMCNEAGFYPTTQQYCVLSVRIERWSTVLSTSEWQEVIRHHFFVLSNMLTELLNEKNIAVVAEKDYQMVCIINLKQSWEEFNQTISPVLLQVMEVLDTEFDISVTMALSDLTQGLCQLPLAFLHTQDALWYNDFMDSDQQVLRYEQLCSTDHPIIRSELMELDKKLISKLQVMDVAGIKYVLHEMIDREFIQETPTVKILRVRLGGICCKILDVLDELRDKIGSGLYYALDPAPKIAEAQTLADLTSALDKIFDAICRGPERRAPGAQAPVGG